MIKNELEKRYDRLQDFSDDEFEDLKFLYQ